MKFSNLMFPELGPEVDKIDARILEYLASDCRMGYAEISKAVNLSRMAVRARVLKLVDSGVIQRFTVQLDARKLGLSTSVFLEVSAVPAKLDSVAKALTKNPKVESVYATTGSTVLHVHAFLENFKTLENFIFNDIYTIDGITDVHFHIMTKKYKGTRLFT